MEGPSEQYTLHRLHPQVNFNINIHCVFFFHVAHLSFKFSIFFRFTDELSLHLKLLGSVSLGIALLQVLVVFLRRMIIIIIMTMKTLMMMMKNILTTMVMSTIRTKVIVMMMES